jgi:OOP family OmpA-OmpF porin
MKVMNKILVLVLILVFAGCANMSAEKKSCVIKSTIAGAVFGGGAGAAAGKPGGTINRGAGAGIGVVTGGLVGGLLGVAFCEDAVDTDGDGVLDSCDKCPNTPPGCPVDENGCATDTDGDGVKDCIDKCPNTPKDCRPVDANGCAKDTDGDGVKDCIDKCPNTPKGCKVDKKGCPIDSDGDGVPDCLDKCKGTPKGIKVDKNGCPPVGGELLILTGINFAFDSAKLDKASETIIDRAVQNLKRNPNMSVLIEGHTDSIGDADYNMGLSVRRAQSVKDYIVSQGIAKERLSKKGFGESQPLESNETEAGRAQNRRVEFVVTAK